ncbi:MAG: hypothetical protein ISR65_18295 [Bacteriovoracaceae bacterium]|nr:hypothetical protein [Bacteriovoracaceae bacterium]
MKRKLRMKNTLMGAKTLALNLFLIVNIFFKILIPELYLSSSSLYASTQHIHQQVAVKYFKKTSRECHEEALDFIKDIGAVKDLNLRPLGNTRPKVASRSSRPTLAIVPSDFSITSDSDKLPKYIYELHMDNVRPFSFDGEQFELRLMVNGRCQCCNPQVSCVGPYTNAYLKDQFFKEVYINPNTIRFTQNSINSAFKNGNTLESMVDDLKNKTITPQNIPPIRIFTRNGVAFTLDNRRLQALRDASLNIRTVPATIQEIVEESWKFTTQNEGKTIEVRP